MASIPSLFVVVIVLLLRPSQAQQVYTDNAIVNCYRNTSASALGYSCTASTSTCAAFAAFRSDTNYDTPISIGYFLNVSAAAIARLNSIADITPIPHKHLVLVPLPCSCSATASGKYYQHAASYTLKSATETYLIVANDTYQGLTTCQAMMEQNPSHDSRKLEPGTTLHVPLRCACPSDRQLAAGYKYLLTYLVTWKDEISAIAARFNVDALAVADANSLKLTGTIFPFTTLLVPLKAEPSPTSQNIPPPPPAPPPATTSKSNRNWVAVGLGIGVGVLILFTVLFAILFYRHRRPYTSPEEDDEKNKGSPDMSKVIVSTSSILSEDSRLLVGSLARYDFKELQKATGFFGEDHRIKGSVYMGRIGGDLAAVKRVAGNVTLEIDILKHLNHGNLVRLSGFCLNRDSTYLVFEFAEGGSLHDLLHRPKPGAPPLKWKRRVQIALDVADALNYLHSYATPPCIHRDLSSSNILLDGDLRAKVANFGLARSGEKSGGVRLTSHVVGTQGYMPPEYLEHGLVSPALDIFSFGVVLLELISGREAVSAKEGEWRENALLLSAFVGPLLDGEDARDGLRRFVDPTLGDDYSFESALAVAQLARRCVSPEPSSRPKVTAVYVALSGIHSAVVDWDPSPENSAASASTVSAR